MANIVTSTGGARIGATNASWPFARYRATDAELELDVTLIGKYKFSRKDVARLESYGWLPIFARGVRIIHTQPGTPDPIIYWCIDPDGLIERTERAGFRPLAQGIALSQPSGSPVSVRARIAGIVAWNGLLLVDIARGGLAGIPGPFSVTALYLTFLGAVTLLFVPATRTLVLKEGRSFGEIQPQVRLAVLVTGLLSFIFTGILLAGFPHAAG